MNRMEYLVSLLNKACEAYYDRADPIMSDYEFDKLYDELVELETISGKLPNSPTKRVGWHHVLKEINDVNLTHKMASLDKCHTIEEVRKFIGNNDCYISIKLDGLSCTLLYEDGKFISAATRGDGLVGSDVTNAALAISSIPKTIPVKDRFIIDGEVIIDYPTFLSINAGLPSDRQFKNPRNLAAGTLTMLDNALVKQRGLRFVAWRVIEDGDESTDSNLVKLIRTTKYGFDTTPTFVFNAAFDNEETLINILDNVKTVANEYGYPCDGAVIAVDSIKKSKAFGETEKFPRHSIAYKYEDELAETTLRSIEWNTSKTGLINPVALFDDVELCGSTVNRATLHNPDYIASLQLGIGDKILIRKANQIIPKVHENITRSNTYQLPDKCPSCGAETELKETGSSHALYCTNPTCSAKLASRLVHFCSRDAANIDGMSEATIEYLMNRGWVTSIKSIYYLKKHAAQWMASPGFGKKSVEKILSAIEKSREITLDRFIYSLSIPLIGKTASKDVAKFCDWNFQTFLDTAPVSYEKIDGFGLTMNFELTSFIRIHKDAVAKLAQEFTFVKPEKTEAAGADLTGKIFVVTGNVNHYKNRKELQTDIETHGGKVTGSVTAKTSYLINNDIESSSSKNQTAKKLNIPIITEEDFIKMIG